jgi:hypothetical protein
LANNNLMTHTMHIVRRQVLPRIALTFAIFSAGALSASGANLLLNGSFESPGVAPGGFLSLTVGAPTLTGWSIVGPATRQVFAVHTAYTEPGVAYPSQDGAAWIDLTDSITPNPQGISQTVATTIGNTYELSYFLGSLTRGGTFGTSSTVNVAINSTPTYSDTAFSGTGSTLGWQQFTHTFVASSTSTNLSFLNGDPTGDLVDGIDNVVLQDLGVVPEPGSFMLLGAGLLGLAARRRRP